MSERSETSQAENSKADVVSLINALEAENIAEEKKKLHPPAPAETPLGFSLCNDCGQDHLPRRVVCCVDGTWMDADGNTWTSEPNENASNIFRIWASIKEGIVTDQDGKSWQQIRRYFKGIGASLDPSLEKFIAGITGNGFEIEIYKVYTYCAFNCCPSRDEIWLFGFSRGAYIVRAVAALMDHMGLLKSELSDYKSEYWDGLRLYRKLRDKAQFHTHQYYQHIVQNTRPSPRVRFIGVLDTVKAVSDANLYDLSHRPTTHHVRHALALQERRYNFKPVLYNGMTSLDGNRSCIEAWFTGSHGNIGGARASDGLALWPLQYLLSEAQDFGLVLGFQVHERVKIENPLDYSLPASERHHEVPIKDGFTLKMWDIRPKLVNHLLPTVCLSQAAFDSLSDRDVPGFKISQCGYSNIVHPSVYLHDDTDILCIIYLRGLSCHDKVQAFRSKLDIKWGECFWNHEFTRKLRETLHRPRILLCGPHGVGKSSLINLVLKQEAAKENSRLLSQYHTISDEHRSPHSPVVFHDSIGFDTGNEEPYRIVQSFIETCKRQPAFVEQLHCIWYCLPSDLTRMSTADQKFFSLINYSGIELKIVFTKADKLRDSSIKDACDLYSRGHPEIPPIQDIFGLLQEPEEVRNGVLNMAARCENQKKSDTTRDAIQYLGINFRPTSHFVSKDRRDQSALDELVSSSTTALRKDVLQTIHSQAIKREREGVLDKLIPKLAALKSKRVPILSNGFLAKSYRIYFYEVQKIAAQAFGMQVPDEALFRDLKEVMADLLGIPDTEELVGKRIWGNDITQLALLQSLIRFLGPIVFPLLATGPFLEAQYRRAYHELFIMCTVIWVYDRMFWFGMPIITRDIAKRAWIELFKIITDMFRSVKDAVNYVLEDDWHHVLTKITNKYKYNG